MVLVVNLSLQEKIRPSMLENGFPMSFQPPFKYSVARFDGQMLRPVQMVATFIKQNTKMSSQLSSSSYPGKDC